jgi:hypothetical protein
VTLRRIAIVAAATLGIGVGVGYAATLEVGSWRLWAGSQTLTKGACTVSGSTNVTDTYVSQASASTSYGSATTMLTKPGTTAQQWTFVRVSLTSCALPVTAGADTATLKLVIRTVPTGVRTLTLTPVLSTWSGTLTWTQAQSLTYGTPVTTTFATGVTNGATLSIPVTIDVDALIKSSTANYGWRISDAGATATGDAATFNSVNATTASLRPQLVIAHAS